MGKGGKKEGMAGREKERKVKQREGIRINKMVKKSRTNTKKNKKIKKND